VVVDDLHVVSASFNPTKTEAPLVTNSDAVLARSVTHQSLKTIARRDPQIMQIISRVNQ
jgi:hypothetical protein